MIKSTWNKISRVFSSSWKSIVFLLVLFSSLIVMVGDNTRLTVDSSDIYNLRLADEQMLSRQFNVSISLLSDHPMVESQAYTGEATIIASILPKTSCRNVEGCEYVRSVIFYVLARGSRFDSSSRAFVNADGWTLQTNDHSFMVCTTTNRGAYPESARVGDTGDGEVSECEVRDKSILEASWALKPYSKHAAIFEQTMLRADGMNRVAEWLIEPSGKVLGVRIQETNIGALTRTSTRGGTF